MNKDNIKRAQKLTYIAYLTSALLLNIYQPTLAAPIEIPEENFFCPQRISRSARVTYEDGEFTAVVEGTSHKIQSYDVKGISPNLTEEQFKKFLTAGYFSLGKAGKDYTLEAKTRLLGGTRTGQYGEYKKKIVGSLPTTKWAPLTEGIDPTYRLISPMTPQCKPILVNVPRIL